MQQPDISDRSLRRALWDLAAIEDDDRQWVVDQLSQAERKRLAAAIENFEPVPRLPVPAHFSEAVETATAQPEQPRPQQAALSLDSLPDWLAVRVLLSMPSADRRTTLRELSWGRRLHLRRRLLADRGGIRLTAATAEALLASVRNHEQPTAAFVTSP
jgi:hypothetical protein